MELNINELSEEQVRILNLSEGKHLVLAPPGTGKTELIAQRVLKAVTVDKFPESEIICLTFTNRAARNMLDRVKQRVPNSKVFISNIHGFGTQFLTKNQLIPLASSFIDDADAEEILKEASASLGISSPKYETFCKKALINKVNNNLAPFLNRSEKHIEEYYLKLIVRYEKIKKESLLYDYDDILVLTLKHLIIDSDNLDFGKFSIIQVDEAQDLNEIQWNIVKYIQKPSANVVLYGDIYQSIFGFNGARLELLQEFTKDHTLHKLSQNFRSEAEINTMLNEYLGWYFTDNKYKIPFQTFSNSHSNSQKLKLLDFAHSNQSQQYSKIEKIAEKFDVNNEQTAMLFYKNIDVELFYDCFDKSIANVFKVTKYDLFRRSFIKDIFSFLNSIYKPFERSNWVRLFKIFAKIPTLRESRLFINKLYENGILPIDLMREDLDYTKNFTDFKELFVKGRLVFFDTETSGLDTFNDDIIQIAAVSVINGKIDERFNVYIKTDKDLTESSKVHKITNSFLEINGVSACEALLLFNDFLQGSPLVAHNLNFDKYMLIYNLKRNNLYSDFKLPELMFDTIDIVKRVRPKLHSYKLSYLINLLSIDTKNTHNAVDDVEATVKVILNLSSEVFDRLNDAEYFILDNMKKLKLFTTNYAPFFNKIKNNNLPVSFRDIIEDFVMYCKMEDANLGELAKLLNHMDLKTKPDIIGKLLSKNLNFYRKCKTSDLITENDKIIISTIHRAKGLEFDNVFIPDFNNYIYPHYAKNLYETCKLLYVAMSRAKKRLILTTGNTYDNSPAVKSTLLKPVEYLFNDK